MIQKYARVAAVLATAATIAACAAPSTQTHVDRVARAKELPNAPYKRVLIVVTTERAATAREFEEVLAKELNNKNTFAYGYHRAASRADVKEDVVRSLADQHDADAILMVTGRLVNATRQTSDEWTDVQARVKGGSSLVDYFRYDYKEYTAPPSADYRVNVQVQSDLFDAASEQRVYTVESRTNFAETTSEIILNEARELAKRMRKDKIVR